MKTICSGCLSQIEDHNYKVSLNSQGALECICEGCIEKKQARVSKLSRVKGYKFFDDITEVPLLGQPLIALEA